MTGSRIIDQATQRRLAASLFNQTLGLIVLEERAVINGGLRSVVVVVGAMP